MEGSTVFKSAFVSKRHDNVKTVANLPHYGNIRQAVAVVEMRTKMTINAILSKLLIVRQMVKRCFKQFAIVGELYPVRKMSEYYRNLRRRFWQAKHRANRGEIAPVKHYSTDFWTEPPVLLLTVPNEPVIDVPAPAPEVKVIPYSNIGKKNHDDACLGHSGNYKPVPEHARIVGRDVHLLGENPIPNWWYVPELKFRFLTACVQKHVMGRINPIGEACAKACIGEPTDYPTCQAAIEAMEEIMLARETAKVGKGRGHWFNSGTFYVKWLEFIHKQGVSEFEAEKFMGKPAYEFDTCRDAMMTFTASFAPIKAAKEKREIEASTAALKNKRAEVVEMSL